MIRPYSRIVSWYTRSRATIASFAFLFTTASAVNFHCLWVHYMLEYLEPIAYTACTKITNILYSLTSPKFFWILIIYLIGHENNHVAYWILLVSESWDKYKLKQNFQMPHLVYAERFWIWIIFYTWFWIVVSDNSWITHANTWLNTSINQLLLLCFCYQFINVSTTNTVIFKIHSAKNFVGNWENTVIISVPRNCHSEL